MGGSEVRRGGGWGSWCKLLCSRKPQWIRPKFTRPKTHSKDPGAEDKVPHGSVAAVGSKLSPDRLHRRRLLYWCPLSQGTSRGLPGGQGSSCTSCEYRVRRQVQLTDLGTHRCQGRPDWRCSPQSGHCRRHPRPRPAAPRGLPRKQDGGKNGKQNKTKPEPPKQ